MALKGVRQALILKRASASRSSGKWNDDDFDVFANGVVVGRRSDRKCSRGGGGKALRGYEKARSVVIVFAK
jgi:hypothetical protein